MFGTVNVRILMIGALGAALLTAAVLPAAAAEPPVINPFGQAPSQREDTTPGYVELSDGTIHRGQVYLTRDKRLQVYDEKMKRQREVPLRVVKQIECKVAKEWMEKEWKFKDAASSVKMFTGREYPAREYVHTITLHDGRTITGPLSGVVYVQPQPDRPTEPGVTRQRAEPERFILQKRAKGELDEKLDSLKYVKQIKLGPDALAEGWRKASQRKSNGTTDK